MVNYGKKLLFFKIFNFKLYIAICFLSLIPEKIYTVRIIYVKYLKMMIYICDLYLYLYKYNIWFIFISKGIIKLSMILIKWKFDYPNFVSR